MILFNFIFPSKNKKDNTISRKYDDIDWYWKLEDEIMKSCWNNDTFIFDWNKWFDRRDEIIHTAPTAVLEGIDSDFRAYGRMKIYFINAIISSNSSDIEAIRRKILSDMTLLQDTVDMFCF